MFRERCSILFVVALTYLIIPPGVRERDASIQFEPEASMTQWKILDEYASVESCEQDRAATMFKAAQLKSDDAISIEIAESHSRDSVQQERRMVDAAALALLLSRCVSAIGGAFDHTDLL